MDTPQGGVVEAIHIRDGAMVQRGQLLLELSNTSLQLDVISREAQITEQLNNLRTLELTHEQNRLANDRQFADRISYVDPGFFEVFDLPVVQGERESALEGNTKLLVSNEWRRSTLATAQQYCVSSGAGRIRAAQASGSRRRVRPSGGLCPIMTVNGEEV